MRPLFTIAIVWAALGCGGNKESVSDPDLKTVDVTIDTAAPGSDLSTMEQGAPDTPGETSATPDVVVDAGPADIPIPIDLSVTPGDAPVSDVQNNPLPDLTTLNLNGSIPQAAVTVPTFAALNSDGSPRGPSDLMGKPTIMWFFPIAGTPG